MDVKALIINRMRMIESDYYTEESSPNPNKSRLEALANSYEKWERRLNELGSE